MPTIAWKAQTIRLEVSDGQGKEPGQSGSAAAAFQPEFKLEAVRLLEPGQVPRNGESICGHGRRLRVTCALLTGAFADRYTGCARRALSEVPVIRVIRGADPRVILQDQHTGRRAFPCENS